MLNDKYDQKFLEFAMRLFEHADSDFIHSSQHEKDSMMTHGVEEKLIALVPEEQRKTAEQYLDTLQHADINRLDFFYIHGIHDGARMLHHLLMD